MDSTKKGNSAGITDRPHRAKASAAALLTSPASARNHASTAQSPRHAKPRHRILIHITAPTLCRTEPSYVPNPSSRFSPSGQGRSAFEASFSHVPHRVNQR